MHEGFAKFQTPLSILSIQALNEVASQKMQRLNELGATVEAWANQAEQANRRLHKRTKSKPLSFLQALLSFLSQTHFADGQSPTNSHRSHSSPTASSDGLSPFNLDDIDPEELEAASGTDALGRGNPDALRILQMEDS